MVAYFLQCIVLKHLGSNFQLEYGAHYDDKVLINLGEQSDVENVFVDAHIDLFT